MQASCRRAEVQCNKRAQTLAALTKFSLFSEACRETSEKPGSKDLLALGRLFFWNKRKADLKVRTLPI